MPKCIVIALVSLILATLACARAEVPITPGTPQVEIVELKDTPTAASEKPATPAATLTPSGYPAPTEAPATAAPPTSTSVIQQPPTDTPTITETPQATDTPQPTSTTAPATPTKPPAAGPSATRGATSVAPTATSAPFGPGPQPIPSSATFTQQLDIDYSGGTLFGETLNLIDRRTETWASIRERDGVFVIDLGAPQNIAGVRVYPKKDGFDPVTSAVTLLRIEVSLNGSDWVTVLTGSGECGAPRCDTLPPGQNVDLGFTPTKAQFVRLVGGPTRFGFAEVSVAVVP